MNTKGQFSGRALASILSSIAFLGMCVTGVILFIVPRGRVANWTGWTLFGLSKDQWQGLHIWLGIVFVVAVLVHLIYNWRPLLSYFKGRVSRTPAWRWEWVLSLLICGVITACTLADIKPFSSLLAWSEAITDSWEQDERRAPVPHAELLTLTELAGYSDNVTVETIITNLQAEDVTVESPEQVTGELAQAHNMTPDALYAIAIGDQGSRRRGIGQMTLKDYCTGAGIEVDTAIRKLRRAGLKPGESMTIREIADTANLHPSQIRTLLE